MRMILVMIAMGLLQSCNKPPIHTDKINGISFVASRDAITEAHIQPILNVHANYVTLMPFGFIKNLQHPEIVYNSDRQWFGETEAGIKQYIEALQAHDIHIMLKPQIWVWRGEYTGHISMSSEKAWREFEATYSGFILDYAQLAEDMHVSILCIGTELQQFVENRPNYWKQLIEDIKKVYKGKLTYAANWDEFKQTPFWGDLDYIGIDAYFPVSDAKTPTVEDCLLGWGSHKQRIEIISDAYNKPVLFTEFGYRSMDYTGKEPWQSDYKLTSLNFEAQTQATQALFETFWNEPWFAGGFVWKWFHNDDQVGGLNDNQFTPQNKPVEDIIRTWYGKY